MKQVIRDRIGGKTLPITSTYTGLSCIVCGVGIKFGECYKKYSDGIRCYECVRSGL